MAIEVDELLIRIRQEGVEAAQRSVTELGASVTTTDAVITKAGKSFEATRVKLDETANAAARAARINKDYEASVTTVTRAVQTGAATEAEAAELIRRAGINRDQALQKARDAASALAAQYSGTTQASDKMTVSAGNQAFAMRQLGVQSVQAISGIATGQGVFQVLIQQGHQVVDVALATGTGFGVLGAAAKAVGSALLSPITAFVAFGAAVGLTLLHASTLESETRALSIGLRAVGRDGELAASGLQSYVRILQSGGVSRADANAILGGLSRNPALGQAQIGQVAGLTADTAAALGTDPQAAAKRLGDAAGGSYSAIKALDDELNILTADQRLAVRVMLEHGQRADAVAVVMGALSGRVKDLHRDALTPAEQAMKGMTTAFGEFADRLASSSGIQALIRLGEALAIIGGNALSGKTGLSGVAAEFADLDKKLTSLNEIIDGGRGATMGQPAIDAAISRRQAIQKRLSELLPSVLDPSRVDTGSAGLASDPRAAIQDQQRQAKSMEDAKSDLTNARRMAGAGPAGQAAMAAQIAAEKEAADKSLDIDAAKVLSIMRVTEARVKEGAARSAELGAIRLQTSAEIGMVSASDEGRAAMLRATAAAEAHAKAATQGGVNEKAFTEAIINRNAAQAASKGAQQLVEMKERIDVTEALIAAEKKGTGAVYQATLAENTRVATAELRAQLIVATEPDVQAKLASRIILIGQAVQKQTELNAAEQAQKAILSGRGVLDDLKAEAAMIGLSAEQRERELAALRATRALISSNQAPDAGSFTETQRALVDQSRTIASANFELKRQQTLYDGIAQSATQAFDQVGQAITNAFLGGSRAAVNWGNIARSAAASVIQQVIKLGVINPVLNSALGTSLPSAGASILGALGGFGGLFGSSSMTPEMLRSATGSGMNMVISGSAGGNMNGGGIMPSGNGLTDMLGISNLLGNGAGFLGGSQSLGSMLGSFGLGMGLGTLANTFARGNSTGGMVGSALGSILLGSLGGLAGGLIGGMFGPGKQHHGWSYIVDANDPSQAGQLTTKYETIDPVAEQQFAQEQAAMANVNAFLKAQGIQASGNFIVGGNNGGQYGESASFDQGFGALRFAANDNPTLNAALSGRSLADPTALQDLTTLVTTTMPGLIGGQGSVKTAIDGLTKSFTDAIAKATEFGLATDDLTTAQAKQIKAVNDLAVLATAQSEAGFQARILAANGDTTAAGLLNFDTQATSQRTVLARQLTDAFGDAYATTTDYSRIMGELNTALDLERKNLTDAPFRQATGNVAGVIGGLASFTAGLSTSAASPLAPLAQLSSARRGFDAVSGAALAGDFGSLQQVQAYAQNLLSVSRNVNGSGIGYANDFSHVVDVLTRASVVNTDTLTVSAMAALAQNQTDQLKSAIASLQSEVAGLRLDMAQSSATPARLVA